MPPPITGPTQPPGPILDPGPPPARRKIEKTIKIGEEQQEYFTRAQIHGGSLARRGRRGSGKLDAAIGGNNLRDVAGHQRNSRVVVILAQIRDGLAAETADFAVGQNFFQAIADFDAVAVIVHGKKNQNAAVGLFGADAEAGGEINGVVLDWPAAERFDRDNDELRLSFLIHLGAQSRRAGLRPRT